MKWAVLLLLLLSASCAKKAEKEAEAVAPVQTAEVRTDSIRRVFGADGILYPRNQASVVPKISAPVRTFYVNRGDRVREGQLLALLENGDLAAATQESKGQFDQAEANYRSTTSGSSLPSLEAHSQIPMPRVQWAIASSIDGNEEP